MRALTSSVGVELGRAPLLVLSVLASAVP